MSTETTAAIQESFTENGYYLARGVYSPEELREMERDFDRIVEQLVASGEQINARWGGPEMERIGGPGTEVLHTHNVQQFSAVWLRAFLQPRFLAAAEAILGPDIILHHSKLFQKPPEKGSPFPMHQDWTYFPTHKDSMMAGIIHVSRATDEMGCVRVYPGSHRLGRITGTSGQRESEVLEKYPLERATILEAEPGDVVFFHYFTLHGSRPNTSTQTRKTVLVQLYAGDDRVEEGNMHTDERLVLQGWNHHATRRIAGARD
jgi:ectoine hydroxylase-related dioxygenase (phytanoyl-CoA dioxygenase family)